MPRVFTVAMRSKGADAGAAGAPRGDGVGSATVYRVEFYSKALSNHAKNNGHKDAVQLARSLVRHVFKEMHARPDCLLEVTGGNRGVRCEGTVPELVRLCQRLRPEDVRMACDEVARWMRVERERKWTRTRQGLMNLVAIVTRLRDKLAPLRSGTAAGGGTVLGGAFSAGGGGGRYEAAGADTADEGDEEDEEDEDLDLNLGGSDDDDDNSGGMALGAMLTRSGTAGGGGGDNSWVAVRYGEIGARFLNMGTVAPGPDPEVNLGPPTPHSMSTVNASIRHLSAFAPQHEWFESGDDWKCLAEDGDEAMRQFTE